METYTTVVTVATSVTTYDLSGSTTDALQINLRRDSTDIELQRFLFEEYLNVPNKSQTGRPTQYTVKRNLANPTIILFLFLIIQQMFYKLKVYDK